MRIRLCVSFIAIALQWYAHGLGAEEAVVYRTVNDLPARSVVERFEKETGIALRLLPHNSRAEVTELSDRLTGEKNQPRADVLWSIPPRAVIILYNRDLFGDPEELPTSVLDMMNSRFNRKACMANPSLGTPSMYAAALFEVLGTDFAEAFFSSLKTNKVAFLSSTTEVRRRVAAGEFFFGIADTDDFYTAVKEGEPVGALFPDQKSFGALVIPNALVLLANAPNPAQGKQFIDFL